MDRRSVLALIVALALAGPALAASDQDNARRAVQSGEVRPLGEILSKVRRSYPGRVLDAGIGRSGGRWIYDLRILGSGGRVTDLRVDAGSGEVLGVRQGRSPGRGRGREPGGVGLGFDREDERGTDRWRGRGRDRDWGPARDGNRGRGNGRVRGGGRD